jgi:hypothetical protein
MKQKMLRTGKPVAKMIGQDGNVFNLIGLAQRALRKDGMEAEAKELCERVFASGSYGEALRIMREYVDIA